MSTSARPQIRSNAVEVLPGEESLFRENYNRLPFGLFHNLSPHPLFHRTRLTELLKTIVEHHPDRLFFNVGRLGVDRGWDDTTERRFSAQEAFEQIETAEAWIILRGVQIVPEYDRLLVQILREIHAVSGRNLERDTKNWNISIIISSPNRITPYHMDADCNYLLQLHGSKTAYVFDGRDRSVVTTRELEQFFLGDINAAQYKEDTQAGAWRFELTPGAGVHIPVTFPHWVQNDNNVSISASINFCFVDRTIADAHRINHYLRRLGINPRQPGQSEMADGVKKFAAKTFRILSPRRR